MAAQRLLSLPPEVLPQVLLWLDLSTLRALRQTCKALRAATDDDSLWRLLVARRFRVSTLGLRTRRKHAALPLAWRDVYTHWNTAARMPSSRMSGTGHPAFARGRLDAPSALVWVTVVSTDDCRLVRGRLRLRIVLQNLEGGSPMRFFLSKGTFRLTDGREIPIDDKGLSYTSLCRSDKLQTDGTRTRQRLRRARGGRQRGTAADRALPFQQRTVSPIRAVTETYSAYASECFLSHATMDMGEGNAVGVHQNQQRHNGVLAKDDFAIIAVDVAMPQAIFEIDALERLASVQFPVSCGDGENFLVTAAFHERVMWDNYDRLPGGWWVRA